jgi:hypothetical protein
LFYISQVKPKITTRLGKENLVTDLKRKKSIFELEPELKMSVKSSLRRESSLFGFVKSNCFWTLEKSAFSNANAEEEEEEKVISIRLFMDFKTAKLLPTILKY